MKDRNQREEEEKSRMQTGGSALDPSQPMSDRTIPQMGKEISLQVTSVTD